MWAGRATASLHRSTPTSPCCPPPSLPASLNCQALRNFDHPELAPLSLAKCARAVAIVLGFLFLFCHGTQQFERPGGTCTLCQDGWSRSVSSYHTTPTPSMTSLPSYHFLFFWATLSAFRIFLSPPPHFTLHEHP